MQFTERNDPEFQQIIAETKARLEEMREQVHLAVGADPSKLFSSMDELISKRGRKAAPPIAQHTL